MPAARVFTIPEASFEGPLELLLELTESRKLLINDVALAAVTDDFIKYVRELEEHPLHETTQFVYVAATLILLKSKTLLPVLELTSEEEASIHDLEDRLRRYRVIRDASIELQRQFGEILLFSRTYHEPEDALFTDRYTTSDALHEAVLSVLKRERTISPFIHHTTVKKVISIEEMMGQLLKKIVSRARLTFREIEKEAGDRVDVIVGFLAILELMKQGTVSLTQDEHFADIIIIERDALQTPEYT